MAVKALHLMATIAAFAFLPAHAAADKIIFVDGAERIGIVTDDPNDPDRIIFTDHRSTIPLPRSRIKEIVRQEPHEAYLVIGDGYLKNGRYEKALEIYEKAGALGAPPDEVKTRIDRTRRMQDKVKRDSRDSEMREIDSLLLLAAEDQQNNRFEQATENYAKARKLDPTPEQNKAIARRLIDLNMAWAQYDMDHVNPSGAALRFEQALKLDPSNEEAERMLIGLRRNDPSRREEVVAFYSKQVEKNPKDPSARRDLADALYGMLNHREALKHYLILAEASAKPTRQLSDRIRSCYLTLTERLAAEGQFREAHEFYKQYSESFDDADPETLDHYEYAVRREDIETSLHASSGTERLNQVAALGLWCRGKGLHEEAKKELRYVLQFDAEHALAKPGLKAYAIESLAESQRAFSRSDYREAIVLARDVGREYVEFADILNKATDIQSDCDRELKRQSRERRQEADDWADLGDDYYARAQTYIANIKDDQIDQHRTASSDYAEARRFLDRAIEAWRSALEIDPSLGEPTERNIDQKIGDATRDRSSLYPNRPLPPRATPGNWRGNSRN